MKMIVDSWSSIALLFILISWALAQEGVLLSSPF